MAARNNTHLETFESIYKRLEEVLLANSGENEFEEIFKFVTMKLWLENHQERNIRTIDEANSLLVRINKEWKDILLENQFNVTVEQFDVCNDIINAFEFCGEGFEGVDGIFEFIISREKKGSKGQYFTPRYIVDFCNKVIHPKKGEYVLDPAAGSGAFVLHFQMQSDTKGDYLWAFDFDNTAVRVARLLMHVAGVEGTHIHKVNSLLKNPAQQHIIATGINDISTTIEDILRIEKKKDLFDVIVTNPPFAGEIIEPDILDSYHISRGKKRIERDVLFVERCIELLKPGGRMAIVLPDNIFGSSDNESLRRWVYEHCRIIAVVGIPRNAFMPHTAVKTSILFLQKRTEPRKNSEKVFFGISEKPGKDGRGRLIYRDSKEKSWKNVDHDLDLILYELKDFIEEEQIGW